MPIQDILDTGQMTVEHRILRYTVQWPTSGGNYVQPPFFGTAISELIDEADITENVISYDQNMDDQSIIQSATLNVKPEWSDTAMMDLLRPNDYVIIQERYRSHLGDI